MKKKVKTQIMVERSFCNICGKEVVKDPFNRTRINIVRGLFKTENFDAHELCVNKIVREAFENYI